ncbi:unnamed protein product [Lactuca virosa]|uniref:DUF674 family protein n=1 Tax=Lactuca virosa TaxID=75947 RepID=A0AAU9PHZ6_9ASTR|nr:unnamed protein product [Lactuca virosa]
METSKKSVQLKVFVDKKKKKVMFAEAANDFVDILFSFFTLPLGTIAKLSRKHLDSTDIKLGSLTSLYESVVSLALKYIVWSHHDLLVDPKNSSASLCQNLKVNPDDTKTKFKTFRVLDWLQGVFVKKLDNFIITDDLNVVPLTLDTSIRLFNSLGVENINLLRRENNVFWFGRGKFLNLLMWSLTTNYPLTHLVLGGGKPCSSCPTSSTLCNSSLISIEQLRKNSDINEIAGSKIKQEAFMRTSGESFCGSALQFPNHPIGCCHTSNKGCWFIFINGYK